MRIAALLCVVLAAGVEICVAQEGAPSGGPAQGRAAPTDEVSCDEVLRSAPVIAASPGFQDAFPERKYWVLSRWARCAVELGDLYAEYEAVTRLVPLAPNPKEAQAVRQYVMSLAIELGKGPEAIETFHTWIAMNPDDLNTLETRAIAWLSRQAMRMPNGSVQALEIHDAVARLGYTPLDPLDSDASLRVDHARLLAQGGRYDEAAERLARIDDLTFPTLASLLVDKSFDAVLARWQPIELRAAAESAVAYARDLAAAYPRHLRAQHRYISALRDVDRDAEALREADRVLAQIEASPDSFQDLDFLSWIHNERAYALSGLDRDREARAAMHAGIDAGARGGRRNVSQAINLAAIYADKGKWKDALATLGSMGRASVYGEMVAAQIRVCAAAETGNKAMLAAELAYLRANAAENYRVLQEALICANELDEAAALYIRRLEHPASRGSALIALQRRAPDRSRLRRGDELGRRREAVQSRPDVQAAFNAVGRALEFPFPIANWANVY